MTGISVAIDARYTRAEIGGVAQATLGIVRALGQLADGPDSYVIVVNGQQGRDFIEPHIGPNQRVVEIPEPPRWSLRRRVAGRLARAFETNPSPAPRLARSDGFIESLGVDLVHFPHQAFVLCALPSVYNPHDLQHLHYPQFFDPESIERREATYRAGCHYAHTVVANSEWSKDDIARWYGTSRDKIQVIPLGPPTVAYPEPSAAQIEELRVRHSLPERFVLYPALTWPHKNHVALLEAIASLRDDHEMTIGLVCTGARGSAWPGVESTLDALRLSEQVRFLGHQPEVDLRALYVLADALVLPTLFESQSFPIFEAWHAGLPVLCSGVTSLPALAGDAALLFDPTPVGIANALLQAFRDPGLLETLGERGRRRLEHFSWERTARAYRAVYRRVAGRQLSREDESLLGWDWMQSDQPR